MALHFSNRASLGQRASACAWVLVSAGLVEVPSRAVEAQEVRGVVVESVAATSSAATAGIQPDDVLLSWSRRAGGAAKPVASGRFRTIFDVRHFELEESQRPDVAVALRRGTARLVRRLTQARWGVTVRPGSDTQDLQAYLEGKRLEDAKQVEAAAAQWGRLTDKWAAAGRIDDAVWLLLRIARAQKAAKDLPSAVQTFTRSERLAAALGPREEAMAIEQHAQAVDHDTAEPLFQQVLRLRRREAGSTLSEASTLVNLGQLERYRDNFATARGYLERAVSIASRLAPGSLFHAQSLGQLAIVVGNDERSERLRREALAIVMRVAPNDGAAASITNNLALFAARHGDNATAERLLRRTLAIDATGGYRDAMTVMNLGVVLGSRGDQIQSEQLLLESLALVRGKGDAGEVAGILQNLGMEALKRGDLDAAERYYMESLRIWQRTTPDRTGNAETLSALGEIAAQRGDLVAATDRFGRALAILQRMDGDMTSVLQNLADASLIAHDVKKAAEYTEAAHAANRNRANEQAAQTQVLRARIAEATADWKAADAAYAQAASLYRHSSPKAWGLVQCLRSRARVAIHLTQLDAAEAWLQEAISLVEAQRTRLAGDEAQQAAFSRRSGAIFVDLVDLMVTRAKITEAFNVLERYRAKSFLEHVAERDLLFADDIPDTLRRERIHAESEYDRAQRELGSLDAKADAAAIVSARARLTAVGAVLANVQNRIRQASPRLAALQYPRPLMAKEAAGALASGTALLTWSVGEERTHLFVLSSNAPAPAVFTIPVGAAKVESRVRAFRSLLQAPPSPPRDSQLRAEAVDLFDLFVKPAEVLINRADHLVIAPDGGLHLLPFAALIRRDDRGSAQYLVEWKSLTTTASATVYAELRKRPRPQAWAAEQVVVFADPKYPHMPVTARRRDGDTDERTETDGPALDPEVAALVRGGATLGALPGSREEAAAVVRLYAPGARMWVGDDASERRARSVDPSTRIVHFAVHGVVNERFPLNSALVFTIPDGPAAPEDNGLLQAWEIMEHMRLRADLVVLSACDTAVGRAGGGEGLLTLARAFHFAGARSVLATLWRVDDRASARLMTSFYERLRAGASRTEALRAAQVSFIRDSRLSDPANWAAYSLSGE